MSVLRVPPVRQAPVESVAMAVPAAIQPSELGSPLPLGVVGQAVNRLRDQVAVVAVVRNQPDLARPHQPVPVAGRLDLAVVAQVPRAASPMVKLVAVVVRADLLALLAPRAAHASKVQRAVDRVAA